MIIFFSCKFGNIVDPLEISLLLQVTCFYTAFAFTGHLVIRSSFYCVLFLFTGLFKVSFLESQGSPLNTLLSNLYFLILDSNSVYIKRSHLLLLMLKISQCGRQDSHHFHPADESLRSCCLSMVIDLASGGSTSQPIC